jgi:hypothetical protein
VEEVGWRTKGLTTGVLLPASSLLSFHVLCARRSIPWPPSVHLLPPRLCLSLSVLRARTQKEVRRADINRDGC